MDRLLSVRDPQLKYRSRGLGLSLEIKYNITKEKVQGTEAFFGNKV